VLNGGGELDASLAICADRRAAAEQEGEATAVLARLVDRSLLAPVAGDAGNAVPDRWSGQGVRAERVVGWAADAKGAHAKHDRRGFLQLVCIQSGAGCASSPQRDPRPLTTPLTVGGRHDNLIAGEWAGCGQGGGSPTRHGGGGRRYGATGGARDAQRGRTLAASALDAGQPRRPPGARALRCEERRRSQDQRCRREGDASLRRAPPGGRARAGRRGRRSSCLLYGLAAARDDPVRRRDGARLTGWRESRGPSAPVRLGVSDLSRANRAVALRDLGRLDEARRAAAAVAAVPAARRPHQRGISSPTLARTALEMAGERTARELCVRRVTLSGSDGGQRARDGWTSLRAGGRAGRDRSGAHGAVGQEVEAEART